MLVRIRLEEISIWLTLVERSKRKFVIEIDYNGLCCDQAPRTRKVIVEFTTASNSCDYVE